MFSIVMAVVLAAGCEKDTDCKGDRICEAGRCVNPTPVQPLSAPPPPPPAAEPAPVSLPPPPPPADFDPSKVYRLNGQLCRDVLNEQGLVQRECVTDTPQQRRTLPTARQTQWVREPESGPPSKPQPDTPLIRSVGDLTAQGGFAAVAANNGSAIFGVFGFSVSGGFVFRSGVGLVGILIAHFTPLPQGAMQLWTLGPALRVGTRYHLTLGLVPTIASVPSSATSSTVGFSGSIVVQAAAVFGHITLMVQPILHFDTTGIVFTLSGGFGVAF